MSNYQKFDTSVIRNRIKDGTYPTLAGANRAIGKTQGLSEDDKSNLKKFAAKHFGADAPAAAPAKKAGKKTAKKAAAAKAPKAAKKASKKAAKKASKRAAKAAVASSEEDPVSVKDVAVAVEASPAAAPKRRGRPPGSAKAQKAQQSQQLELPLTEKAPPGNTGGSNSLAGKATLMGNVIGTCSQMLSSITQANNLIPKEVAAEGSGVVAKVMTRAVRVLDQEVVTPLLQNEENSAKSTTAATKTRKPPSRPRNPAPTVAEAPVETAADETVEEDDNDADGLPLDALSGGDDEGDVDLESLSEEERLGVEALRSSAPVNLRTPSVNSAAR